MQTHERSQEATLRSASSVDSFEAPTRRELADMVNQWEKHAGEYFVLAEREQDPIGKKFYQSSAVAYSNCAAGIRQLLESGVKKACQTLSDSRSPSAAS